MEIKRMTMRIEYDRPIRVTTPKGAYQLRRYTWYKLTWILLKGLWDACKTGFG